MSESRNSELWLYGPVSFQRLFLTDRSFLVLVNSLPHLFPEGCWLFPAMAVSHQEGSMEGRTSSKNKNQNPLTNPSCKTKKKGNPRSKGLKSDWNPSSKIRYVSRSGCGARLILVTKKTCGARPRLKATRQHLSTFRLKTERTDLDRTPKAAKRTSSQPAAVPCPHCCFRLPAWTWLPSSASSVWPQTTPSFRTQNRGTRPGQWEAFSSRGGETNFRS